MPLQATSGAASYDAFGGGVPVVPNYIEDVFSTWLYTGNDSTQTITNGIDLSTKGGLVFIKNRTNAYGGFAWYDTARGVRNLLRSNSIVGQLTAGVGQELTAFNTTGFSIGPNDNADINISPDKYASWTFRKQPKFFDVVTFSGDVPYPGAGVSHNLGSVPGCIICKRTDSTSAWGVWHRANSVSASVTGLSLNTTGAALYTNQNFSSAMTSTSFAPALVNDASGNAMNTAGATYVAYIFAHDAGGFGLTGTDNVISCGSFTTDGSGNATVNLGYEAQWILAKRSISPGGNWLVLDTMRELSQTGTANLFPNTSGSETTSTPGSFKPTATGFSVTADAQVGGSDTWIYIAIRKGPMKVPTDGTKVFYPLARAGTSAAATITGVGFSPDTALIKPKDTGTSNVDRSFNFFDRLRKQGYRLSAAFTDAEDTSINFITSFDQDGMTLPSTGYTATNGSSYNYINYFFKRAPSFFDEVCYTGTGAAQTLTHNLAAVPELMISRRRDAVAGWAVYSATLGATKYMRLQTDDAPSTGTTLWNDTAPTSTQFTLGSTQSASSGTYVQYLFATCAGVSKVGSYTGNGSSQTINCGFTGGSRFVLIKKTSGTGDWMISDSARGIVSGSDPYLELNNTNAEVTGEDWLDTDSTGFVVNEVSGSNANTNGATYIFLAIA